MANSTSGFYEVFQPDCAVTSGTTCRKRVFCDMTTDGGGWTVSATISEPCAEPKRPFPQVIQQRRSGTVDFFVPWSEYKLGFGTDDEFWLGNEYVYSLTNRPSRTYELLVQAEDASGSRFVSRYSAFRLGPEATSYQMSYNTYGGNFTSKPYRVYHFVVSCPTFS